MNLTFNKVIQDISIPRKLIKLKMVLPFNMLSDQCSGYIFFIAKIKHPIDMISFELIDYFIFVFQVFNLLEEFAAIWNELNFIDDVNRILYVASHLRNISC